MTKSLENKLEKNRKYFGVVQNLNYFYKNQYLASSILAFYLDPYFSLTPEDNFYQIMTKNKGTEEDFLQGIRLEKEIEGKIFYTVGILQDYGYLEINRYLKEDWEYIKDFCFLPSFRSIYHFDKKPISGPRINWLNPLRKKLKVFYFFYFKQIFPDVVEVIHKFNYHLEKRKGNIYDVDESLVDHFSPERRIDLDLFFSEEELKLLIYGMSRAIKPKYYDQSFFNNKEEYKVFLLDLYGEKGSGCQYTNFDENFLKNYETIEDLIYVDWLLGYSQKVETKAVPYDTKFPHDTRINSQMGWIVLKKLTDNLSRIL